MYPIQADAFHRNFKKNFYLYHMPSSIDNYERYADMHFGPYIEMKEQLNYLKTELKTWNNRRFLYLNECKQVVVNMNKLTKQIKQWNKKVNDVYLRKKEIARKRWGFTEESDIEKPPNFFNPKSVVMFYSKNPDVDDVVFDNLDAMDAMNIYYDMTYFSTAAEILKIYNVLKKVYIQKCETLLNTADKKQIKTFMRKNFK